MLADPPMALAGVDGGTAGLLTGHGFADMRTPQRDTASLAPGRCACQLPGGPGVDGGSGRAMILVDQSTEDVDATSSATIADSPRVACGNQPNIRTAVRYSSRTTMPSS